MVSHKLPPDHQLWERGKVHGFSFARIGTSGGTAFLLCTGHCWEPKLLEPNSTYSTWILAEVTIKIHGTPKCLFHINFILWYFTCLHFIQTTTRAVRMCPEILGKQFWSCRNKSTELYWLSSIFSVFDASNSPFLKYPNLADWIPKVSDNKTALGHGFWDVFHIGGMDYTKGSYTVPVIGNYQGDYTTNI